MAALDYLDAIGRDNIFKHDQELGRVRLRTTGAVERRPVVRAKSGRAGLVSFLLDDVHAHDVVTVADRTA